MKIYTLTIILIILLSAFFRFGFPDLMIWAGDEDGTASKFLDFASNRHLPPLITRSHGIYVVPILDILLYGLMLFVHDPRIVILLAIGIPNTVAVILCFLFCLRFIDKRIAILSTVLFGFSSWAILYSRNLWYVDILQFFSILIFYILASGLKRSKVSFIILAILLLPILPSLHLTGFSIFISVFLILFVYYCKLDIRYLLISAGILIVILFFITGWLHAGSGLERNIIMTDFNLRAVYTTMNLIVRRGWYFGYLGIQPRYPIAEVFIDVFLKAFFIFGCVYTLKRMFQDWKTRCFSPYVIIGSWYFVFVIMFNFTNLVCHGHYFMTVLPVLFIITSVGFFSIIDYISGRAKIYDWELLLLSSIFVFWAPWIAIPVISVLLLIRIRGSIVKYILYLLTVSIALFLAFSNIQLFMDIERVGGVPGNPDIDFDLDLGAKIRAARFIIEDAEPRYRHTGLKSSYSTQDDQGYGYIFKYLMLKKGDFISTDKVDKGYHYTIIGDLDRTAEVKKNEGYLYHRRIGPKLVVVERIDET